MSSTEINLSSIPLHLVELAQRMGMVEFTARLNKEQRLVREQGKGQGRGFFRLENKCDFYSIVRFGLRATGLWNRAFRNYLDIKLFENEVYLQRLPEAFDGYRILQLTDLHADLHPDFPAAVRRAVLSVNCDLVVVTGDFRTSTYGDHTGATKASIEILKDLTVPCWAILGNHDFLEKVISFERAGIRFLLNENTMLQRGDSALYIAGIDDPNFYHTHNYQRALAGVPPEACKILLSHAPQTYKEAAELGFDLQLSGHTHGGQICLPDRRVLLHDTTSPRHVLSGRWCEGKLQGYTSRGTGASGLPARLNCPAEITLHTLRRDSSARP